MRLTRIVACLAILTGITLFVYLQWGTELKGWLEPAPQKADPLSFLKGLPEPPKKDPVPKRKPKQRELFVDTPQVDPHEEAEELAANSVPNEEVAKVLMQILRAKKLADGISLGVSDTQVTISGSVKNREQFDQIVRTVDKGRENREINTSRLSVSAED